VEATFPQKQAVSYLPITLHDDYTTI